MPLLLLSLAFALAACADSGGDPCVAVDQASARHVAGPRERGLSADQLEQHRAAARAALRAELSPGCRHEPAAAPPPMPLAVAPRQWSGR